MVLIKPASANFDFAASRTENDQARLTACLTRLQEALEVSLKVLNRRREEFVIRVTAYHLLLVKHVRGELLEAPIGAMVDEKRMWNCSCPICAFHHADQHLRNPRVVSNII